MREIKTQTVVEEWNGLTKNDAVKVRGERGDFRFRSACLDASGNAIWVTVIGGRWQHTAFRHFIPERILKIKQRSSRDAK